MVISVLFLHGASYLYPTGTLPLTLAMSAPWWWGGQLKCHTSVTFSHKWTQCYLMQVRESCLRYQHHRFWFTCQCFCGTDLTNLIFGSWYSCRWQPFLCLFSTDAIAVYANYPDPPLFMTNGLMSVTLLALGKRFSPYKDWLQVVNVKCLQQQRTKYYRNLASCYIKPAIVNFFWPLGAEKLLCKCYTDILSSL